VPAELDKELKQSGSLAEGCGAAGFRFHNPSFRSEGAAVADANRTVVVLVAVIVGTGDEADGILDVGGVDDGTFASDLVNKFGIDALIFV
jgi:2-keto-3-deoxy-L-rhamnonate aldolase RhmA